MKILAVFVTLMIIVGCTGSVIVIPDEPIYEKVSAYRFDKGVCFDNENEAILQRNMEALNIYAKRLRELLLKKAKEGL